MTLWLRGLARLSDKNYVCTTRMAMATRLGTMVTYLKGLRLIELLDPLATWYSETTWSKGTSQIKPIISPLTRSSTTPNFVGCWLTVRDSHSWSPINLWSRGQCEITWHFKSLYSIFAVLMANKLGRVLTSGRCFSPQTLSSPTTSCLKIMCS